MTGLLKRRTFLAGASVGLVAACGGSSNEELVLPPQGGPDPLAKYRIPEDASLDVWQRQVDFTQFSGGADVLALSGGGEDGAFGAGLLNGWSERGTRPDFDIVTGISTGALIAPFACLGRAEDQSLWEIFTQYDSDDILRARGLPGLFGTSLFDTAPLATLIEQYVSDDVVSRIAERHRNGARLFVVTSNLDTGRADIWNMGVLAQDGRGDLFRALMRASSALPAVFPPVTIEYSADGQIYRETHLDGGLNMQFLALPEAALLSPANRRGRLYIIVNNTIDPDPMRVPRSVLGISQQSLTTMVRASARSSLTAIRASARSADAVVSIASIQPESGIVFDASERFSQAYMVPLFNYGFERSRSGRIWDRGS